MDSRITREPAEVVDHHEVDLPLVLCAEGEQPLELSPLGRLGRLAFLDEHPDYFDHVALALLLARHLLDGQADVLCLLLREYPAVRDRACHGDRSLG